MVIYFQALQAYKFKFDKVQVVTIACKTKKASRFREAFYKISINLNS
jgi:hypothetical protein